ncbi:hypothetical protein NX059_010902 [Plenodomus lindquistii]|nr:hypothetical protein NX059_010902 [Plenodomus lindquistii]
MKHARARLEVDDNDRFVLSHYNKSVRALIQRMTNTYEASEVALVTCLLFACMEFLRGNYHTAFTHMKNGLSIITERQKHHAIAPGNSLSDESGDKETTSITHNTHLTEPMPTEYVKRGDVAAPHPVTFHEFPRPTRNSTTVMETTLVPMFIRGISSALLYGVNTTNNLDVLAPTPPLLHQEAFTGITEAQQAGHELRNSAILHLHTMGQKYIHRRPPSEEDCPRKDRLLKYHRDWFGKVDALERSTIISKVERVAMSSIKMSLDTAFILTACSLDTTEMEYEAHLEQFQKIIHHARIIMEHRVRTITRGPRFTFEICIIPPVFIVATRCRCPVTRRAAVDILEQNTPPEGLWDAQQHVLLAKRAIEVEEQDVNPATGWPMERARQTSCVSSADMDRTRGFWASFLPARSLGQLDVHGKQKTFAGNLPYVISYSL